MGVHHLLRGGALRGGVGAAALQGDGKADADGAGAFYALLELDLAELEPPEAASAMEEAAQRATHHFLQDTLSRSQEELRRLAGKELEESGINEKDIQIYIEADEGTGHQAGDLPSLTARVILPASAKQREQELRELLEKKLDIPVQLTCDGEER